MKKGLLRLLAASAVLSCAAFAAPLSALAACTPACKAGFTCNASNVCVASSTTQQVPTELENPLGVTNINQFIGKLISAALGLSGAVALLMFVWGGVQWLTSGGNVDRIKSGKSTLTWAALGIVVIFTSYTLVNVLINALAGGSA